MNPDAYSFPQRATSFFILVAFLVWSTSMHAGGPLRVGSTFFGVDGQAFTWDVSQPIPYRTDGGPLGNLTNAAANARVQQMFQKWQDVPTSSISFQSQGSLLAAPGFSDGDVNTIAEFDAIANCGATQNPIIYDANGSLTTSLGFSSGVIGFAGPCNSSNGKITGGRAVLNGKWQDGNASNGELSASAFDAAFIHEFGHFSGLDHSQINEQALFNTNFHTPDYLEGLPTMFPILLTGSTIPEPHPASTLAIDDVTWISRLYPDPSIATSFGSISGTIIHSDGISPIQGANVILRRVNDPATPEDESVRIAVSVVSGYRFTGNPGQTVTGTNNPGNTTFFSHYGSRDHSLRGLFEVSVPPGTYSFEVGSIMFEGGSGVGPLDPPILSGGTLQQPIEVTVAAGESVTGLNLVLNGGQPRFDQFEGEAMIRGPFQELPFLRPRFEVCGVSG